MEVFAKLIKALARIFQTLGSFLTVAMIFGILLVASFFTPLFSKGMLSVLNEITLPERANLSNTTTAIVVLGGGLTNDQQNNIIVNQYTEARLKTAVNLHQKTQLPIVVSGKEAPWMMAWLQRHDVWWVVPEKNSVNTCENAKFTAETVKIHNVILVTDPYHMNRARRQFALYDIATTPYIAELNEPTDWHKIGQNLKHSRRAMYEFLAFVRDIFFPQVDCKTNH